jgi:hypothetical protein
MREVFFFFFSCINTIIHRRSPDLDKEMKIIDAPLARREGKGR